MSRLFLLLFVSLLLSVSGRAETTGAIRVGWIGPLTGNAATLGIDSVEAIRMVFESIREKNSMNGRTIELVVENDEYVAAKTISAYERLVHRDGIRILFVINYSALMALAPKAQKDGVLIIDPIDCDETIASLPRNVICISQMAEQMGIRSVENAIVRRLTPSAILYYGNDGFFENIAKVSAKRLKELGHPPLLVEPYQRGESNFRTVLTRARNAGVNSLFFFGYDELGVAMRQARELGITAQFYSSATILSSVFREAAGTSVEGTIFSVWKPKPSTEYETFLEKFRLKVGRLPTLDVCSVPSYDIAMLLLDYFKSTNASTEAVDQLTDFFYATQNYRGASGVISVGPDGATRTFEVKTFRLLRGSVEPLVTEAEL